MIPFNKPFLTGKETAYISDAVSTGKISGNGIYTHHCQDFFQNKYNFKKCLLTTSCTDALEMAAILIDIKPGDEVIMPSYTFVSTALAFVRQGAVIRFIDSKADFPNMDESKIESLINVHTKAIVVVHYAGVAVDMDYVMQIANKYNLFVVEDAAQSIDSFYNKKPLGGIGHLGCFSFHETKNINAGEGGLLTINDERFINRAEIIWEKGTNRAEFFRGEVNKYGWVDTGSSFLPSELTAAFLYAQLENIEEIQAKRIKIWDIYKELLSPLSENACITIQQIPNYATNNAHMFFIICKSLDERISLIEYLKNRGIYSVFHYISLHSSPYYLLKHDGRDLKYADYYTDHLLRLPMYYDLKEKEVEYICQSILSFYTKPQTI